MDLRTVVAYLFGLLLVYLLARAAIVPLRYLAVIGYRACLGAAALWLGNAIAAPALHTTVAINPITAVLAGSLGVPGVLLLLSISWLVQ